MTTPTITRDFALHDRALDIWINHQAGTLAKSLLEAVMNSIDANSPFVAIDITSQRITIRDEGHGFRNRDSVINYFSTIGTPHEAGDAVFGRFRMGRCQIFKQGASRWRTNTFEFVVDHKNNPDHHEFTENLPFQKGCTIEIDLYTPLNDQEVLQTARTMAQWTLYMSTDIIINGEKTNIPPEGENWDINTGSAYISITETPVMTLYNKGAFVMEEPASTFGTGGTIVTKENLDLIYARNGVKEDCKIMSRIKRSINNYLNDNTSSETMTASRRANILDSLLTGTEDISKIEIFGANILEMATGSHWSFEKLSTFLSRQTYHGRREAVISAVEDDPRKARLVHATDVAIVFGRTTIENLSLSNPSSIIEVLLKIVQRGIRRQAANSAIFQQESSLAYSTSALETALKACVFRPIADLQADLPDHKEVPRELQTAGQKTLGRIIASTMADLTNRKVDKITLTDAGDACYKAAISGSNIFVDIKTLPRLSSGIIAVDALAMLIHSATQSHKDENTPKPLYGAIYDSLLSQITKRTQKMIAANKTDDLRNLFKLT